MSPALQDQLNARFSAGEDIAAKHGPAPAAQSTRAFVCSGSSLVRLYPIR